MSAPFAVGDEVQIRAFEGVRCLGVVSRVWANGKYLTILVDGSTFVRLADNVTRCVGAS